MSDRAHSWDAEHRRQLERAGAIGGGYSARGVHGAHGAEETHPVTVEPESSDEAPAQPSPHPAGPAGEGGAPPPRLGCVTGLEQRFWS